MLVLHICFYFNISSNYNVYSFSKAQYLAKRNPRGTSLFVPLINNISLSLLFKIE